MTIKKNNSNNIARSTVLLRLTTLAYLHVRRKCAGPDVNREHNNSNNNTLSSDRGRKGKKLIATTVIYT